MAEEIDINNIITFDNVTGLKVSSRGEILEDLKYLTKVAYGSDYVIEQGNEWYSFLDLLSGSLAEMGGAIQKVYNSLSFVGASGVNLDNVVSFVGITRKAKKNSTVLIKAEIEQEYRDSVTRPYTIPAGKLTLKDHNGNLWENTEALIINEFKEDGETPNYVGTAIFMATDRNDNPTNIVLEPYNDGNPTEFLEVYSNSSTSFQIEEGIVFMNEVSSELGNQEENDAQLRARYKDELYRNTVGTVEGVIAQIKEKVLLNYVYVYENSDNNPISVPSDPGYGMTPHSIWVITDGKSTWDGNNNYSIDPNDVAIAYAILNYKSLGCSVCLPTNEQTYDPVTGTGAITTRITVDSEVYEIPFTRASEVPCYIDITLVCPPSFVDSDKKASIEYSIKQNIVGYISALGIGNDVLQSGLSSAIYNVIESNEYADYVFDISSINVGDTPNPSYKRQYISISQFASIEDSNINITWTN